MEEIYDITIIGGGPTGMFAGYYAGLRDTKTQIIESLPQLGGQVSALYPEKTILDVAGYPQIKGKDLIHKLNEQLALVDTEIKLNQTVENVELIDNVYHITTNQTVTKSRSILIATGVGAFNPRKLAVENAEILENKQLFYGISELNDFKDQSVLVAGGGDSAIDLSLLLDSIGDDVYLLHRREQFRALEHSVEQLNRSTIKQVTPYMIKALNVTENEQVEVVAQKMKTQEPLKITVDKVLVNYGFSAKDNINERWNIDLDRNKGQIKVDQTSMTNLKYIAAVGDVATYDGKQSLIATGFGEAPIAINNLVNQLFPERRGPMHSTSMHK